MSDDPLIGRQLANFRVERLIGRGGMAWVYYGWDVKLERPVAIKVMDVSYRGEKAYAKRFLREAQTVARWRHENIAQVYYVDALEGILYFVMEYLEGDSLDELLSKYAAKGELMPHDGVLHVARAVASALDYAHRKGIIHRDVKPSNIIVTNDGSIYLIDFGLAMDLHRGTLGKAFGTPHYIAPEQANRSADAVPQSDLYSLAVILYQMLTGSIPFDDASPFTVALQHTTLDPPPPREINPDLNVETEAVLLKALSKFLGERYETGAALIDALEKALRVGQPAPDEKDAKPSTGTLDDTLIGQQLDEYNLEALLGKGGMARVYRALDVRAMRYVAIKIIDVRFRSDADMVERFEREAKAIAQLEHPNVVRLYRYGEANDLLYIAMQYVEGVNLRTLLDNYLDDLKLIEPTEAKRIVRGVCLALDYSHSKGVIHRDVKPLNIMLDKEGNTILTDYGLALLTEVETYGEILGTPHYIAPEQAISSAGAVPQSDLYSVGVILYEMFTRVLPFDGATPMEIARMHLAEPPIPPSELHSEVSPELEAVILKGLAKEPDERYATGAALADAVDQALQVPHIEASPAAPAIASPSIPERVAVHLEEHPLPPYRPSRQLPQRRLLLPGRPQREQSWLRRRRQGPGPLSG